MEETYDGYRNIVSDAQSHSGNVSGTTLATDYTYDPNNNDRLTSIQYPEAETTVDYNYGSSGSLNYVMGQISSLNDSTGTIQSYSYLGLDTESGATYGNGITLSVSFDSFGRTSSLQYVQSSAGGSFEDDQYTYDADGNVLSHLGGVDGTQTYTYDGLNRLTNYNVGTGSLGASYSLNAAGDWSSSTTVTGSGYYPTTTTASRTNNAQNQATVVGGNTLAYDADGNTLTDQAGHQYVYDAWNRLVTVKNSSGGTIAAYTYDAMGRRITTTEGGVTSDNYFSNQSLVEQQVSGTTTSQYVWGPSYVNQLVQETIGGTKYYVEQDADWNVTSVTNSSGGVVEDYSYDPYGNITVHNSSGGVLGTSLTSSTIGQIIAFQGGWTDVVTGLVHFQARDLNTGLGTWIEQDPAGYVDGPNRYQLEISDPITLVDPMGLESWIPTWSSWTGWPDLPQGAQSFKLSHSENYVAPCDDEAAGDDILTEFFNSVGPEHRHFGQNSFMTNVIKHTSAVDSARNLAMQELNDGAEIKIDDEDQGTARFLWDIARIEAGKLTSGAVGNMGFVGSFHGTITVHHNCDGSSTLHFHIYNSTSKQSGGGQGPDRSVDQTWDWDETVPAPAPAENPFGPGLTPGVHSNEG
jgi:RHS repeat-associated protein